MYIVSYDNYHEVYMKKEILLFEANNDLSTLTLIFVTFSKMHEG